MKVIKDANIEYLTLEDSLTSIPRDGIIARSSKADDRNEKLISIDIQKHSRFFQIVSGLNQRVASAKNISETKKCYLNAIKEIVACKDFEIFLFDETQDSFFAPNENCEDKYLKFINSAYANGVLDWVFEENVPKLIANAFKSKLNDSSLNLLVLPVLDGNVKKGLFAVLTPVNSIKNGSYETQALNILMASALPAFELYFQKRQLNSTYEELQLYQSKLSNDFKLSAIGELTSGIVEELMDPAQVIMSCTDFIEKEYEEVDKKITSTVFTQVNKIETVINRLSKFASVNSSKISIYPVNLTELIKDYHDVVLSSLKYKNYEFIWDFENDLPPILSNSTYVHQLLTNLFTLVGKDGQEAGGILIQTKYSQGNVYLRFITTDQISDISDLAAKDTKNLTIKMINNLMKKHEGDLEISPEDQAGTTIVLRFPLKRKIRK